MCQYYLLPSWRNCCDRITRLRHEVGMNKDDPYIFATLNGNGYHRGWDALSDISSSAHLSIGSYCHGKKRQCMKCHWLLCLEFKGWGFWVGRAFFVFWVLGISVLSLVFSPEKQSGHAIRLWPWLNTLMEPNGLGEQQPFRPTFGLAQNIFLQIKPQHAKITH